MKIFIPVVFFLLNSGFPALGACPPGSPASWVDAGIAGPPARSNHAISFDSTRNVLVLFGGRTPAGELLRDLWEFDGNAWTERTVASPPPARYGHAMFFWAPSGETWVLSGRNATGPLSEAWYYNGTRWATAFIFPPAGREFLAVAVDSVRQRALMHGGTQPNIAPNSFTDTWEFDGTAWTRRSTGGSGGHSGHAMVFDAGRNQIVSIGGIGSSLLHTIRWRPANNDYDWGPNSNMPLRRFCSGAYDPQRQRLVVLGGIQNDGCTSCAVLTDTRELAPATNTWTLADTGASGVGGTNGSTILYVPALGNWPGGILRFGGLDSSGAGDTRTWLWKTSCCPSDFNGDGFVEDADFVVFAAAYNILDCSDPAMPSGCPADLNADAFVDDADFVLFAPAYNELVCP
jgi:hypothetical protein